MVAQVAENFTIPIEDLEEFLCSRMESDALTSTIISCSEPIGILYRGLMYRRKNLEKGRVYEHWNDVSSWSLKDEMAQRFACNNYVPEGLLEEVYQEKYGAFKNWHEIKDIDEIIEEFVPIVLVDKSGKGFYVNGHYPGNRFNIEEEVIVHQGKWIIESIEERTYLKKYNYYEVQVRNCA